MRRPFAIALLALGTVLGYGFAFHSMRYHHHYGYGYDGWCGRDWNRQNQAPATPKVEPPQQ